MDPRYVNPYDLDQVGNALKSIKGVTVVTDTGRLVRQLQEATRQRDELLAACEELCGAIKFLGESKASSHYSAFIYERGDKDVSIEYVRANWKEHIAGCLVDAYEAAQVTLKGNQ